MVVPPFLGCEVPFAALFAGFEFVSKIVMEVLGNEGPSFGSVFFNKLEHNFVLLQLKQKYILFPHVIFHFIFPHDK